MATSVIDRYWKFFLSVLEIGQYFRNFEETISNNDLNARSDWSQSNNISCIIISLAELL